jgi:hypothetical protein
VLSRIIRAAWAPLGFLVVTIDIWYLFGGPYWLLFGVVSFTLGLGFLSKAGVIPGLILSSSAVLLFQIWIALCSSALGWSLLASIFVSSLTLGIFGVLKLKRQAAGTWIITRTRLVNFVWASSGTLIWVAGLLVAQFVPRASKLGWVMLGDSANNILMARDVVAAGGIQLGSDANPAPLSSALIGFALAPTRQNTLIASSLQADVSALASLWAVLIGLSCLLIGALVQIAAGDSNNQRNRLRVMSGLASLLPLSWFVSGYPLDFGFFNSQLALPLLFASLLAFYATKSNSWINLLIQPVVGTLLLATWAPLVLVPLVLFASTILIGGRALWAKSLHDYLFLALAICQFVVYAAVVLLPMLMSISSSVSVGGGVYEFSHSLLWSFAILTPALARLASGSFTTPAFVGSASVSLGLVAGELYLLFLNRALENPWTYYPLKFLWIALVVLLVLCIVHVSVILIRYVKRPFYFYSAIVLAVLVTIIFLNWSPMKVSGYVWKDPLQRIYAGSYMGRGDSTAKVIFTAASGDTSEFFWNSGIDDEGAVDFWLLQDAADSIKPRVQRLREFAYGMFDAKNPESICQIARETGGKLIVHTAQHDFAVQANKLCPELQIEISD